MGRTAGGVGAQPRASAPAHRRLSRAELASAAATFAALAAFRLWGIQNHFWLLWDQIRDWDIALRPLHELPLLGPPTHFGGYTIGPAYYWLLWIIRVALGSFFDDLPHAGGIGLGLLQSAVDALLLVAVWRRTGSPWLAAAKVVLLATAAYDRALSPLVWNPVAGSTLAKAAFAMVLLGWHRGGPARIAATMAVAWCAVQAYTGAVFVAAGVFLAIVAAPLLAGDRRAGIRAFALAATVVALLQVPHAVHQIRHRFTQPAMGAVTGSVLEVLSGTRPPEVSKSVGGFVTAVQYIQIQPWQLPYVPWLLLAAALVVCVRHRRDPILLIVTLAPPALALLGYSLFLADLDAYYYLSLMPGTVLVVLLAVTAVPFPAVAKLLAILSLVGALALVPARTRASEAMHRMPEYRALVQGSRTLVARGQPVRAVETDFALPPTSNPEFIHGILGGEIDRTARWVAVIMRDGRVSYREVTDKD